MSRKRRKVIRIVVTEEEDDVKGSGRPNSWWAERRRQEEEEKKQHPSGDVDTFGGDYRAVRPAPHRGAASVGPQDTIGAEDTCWCGEPLGHDWPGKDKGRKHPKREEATNMSRQMTGTLDRRDLRGYHSEVQAFIMQCTNDDGLAFRIGRNSLLLYPPDNSSPVTVYARNTDRQIRQLRKWYVTHVHPFLPSTDEEVTEESLAALAEAVNDRAEHPSRETHPAEPEREPEREPEPEPKEEAELDLPTTDPPRKDHRVKQEAELPGPESDGSAVAPPVEEPEWVPYVRESDGPSPNIVTNGKQYKCTWCEGTDHPFLADNRRGIGGHNRMRHSDTSNIHGPEARARAIETQKANRIKEQVLAAIETLNAAIGVETADRQKVEELEATVDRLTGELREQSTLVEQLQVMTQRAEEAEAKLALIREATGL